MAPNRFAVAAADWAVAVKAGTIASRNGNATVTPAPRRKVRRDNDILEMNMAATLPQLTGRDALSNPLLTDPAEPLLALSIYPAAGPYLTATLAASGSCAWWT